MSVVGRPGSSLRPTGPVNRARSTEPDGPDLFTGPGPPNGHEDGHARQASAVALNDSSVDVAVRLVRLTADEHGVQNATDGALAPGGPKKHATDATSVVPERVPAKQMETDLVATRVAERSGAGFVGAQAPMAMSATHPEYQEDPAGTVGRHEHIDDKIAHGKNEEISLYAKNMLDQGPIQKVAGASVEKELQTPYEQLSGMHSSVFVPLEDVYLFLCWFPQISGVFFPITNYREKSFGAFGSSSKCISHC